MQVEIQMPRMGQSMEEGTVVKWMINKGDPVKKGDPLAEIETDKSVITLESSTNGTVEAINASVGEVVPVGVAIVIIEDGKPGGKAADTKVAVPTGKKETSRVEVSPAARKYAESMNIDLSAIPSPGFGKFITKADIDTFIGKNKAGKTDEPVKKKRINASPVAIRLAGEMGVDLEKVTGTGIGGMISKEDVNNYVNRAEQGQAAQKPADSQASVVTLSKARRKSAETLQKSKQTIPHFYVSVDINMDRALGLRESLKNRGEDVSINDLITRGVVIALGKHPGLNATFAENEVVQFPNVDIAVAVSKGDDLLTPVIKHSEQMSLVELSKAAKALIARTRSGSLTAEDMEPGSFTISNLGMFDITEFSAIINPPQVAILAVGKLQKIPVFDATGNVTAAHVVKVTLSADHRATDGVKAAMFLKDLKNILEDGFQLL